MRRQGDGWRISDRIHTLDWSCQAPANFALTLDGRATIGGSWGAYYWNGYIYSSEMDRGFDILELEPSEHLSKNEIEAAKLVRLLKLDSPVRWKVLLVEPCSLGQVPVASVYQPTPVFGGKP